MNLFPHLGVPRSSTFLAVACEHGRVRSSRTVGTAPGMARFRSAPRAAAAFQRRAGVDFG